MFRLRVGEAAPDFDLPGTGGRTYSLGEYRGKGLIVCFYPGDFTPVCTKQFCSYRDDGDRVERLGLPMLGISGQSVASHERFSEENGLKVPLLSDVDKGVARRYKVLGPGGLIRRAIFLIDRELVIRYRHVALLSLTYRDVGDLEKALAGISLA